VRSSGASLDAVESSWPRATTLPLKSEAEPQAPSPKIELVFLSQNWSNGRLLGSPRFDHDNMMRIALTLGLILSDITLAQRWSLCLR
jgi:hypothetical protein